MKKSLFLIAYTLLLVAGQAAFGQDSSDAAAGAFGCAACGSALTVVVVIISLNIALLVWVARDAKARGVDNAVLWVVLVFFTGLIGLIIYILSRPQGNLVQCSNCGNKRLQASVKCPHCGIGS